MPSCSSITRGLFLPKRTSWRDTCDNPKSLRALILQTVLVPHRPARRNDVVQMDGSAAPPAEHARVTILQNGNHEMGHAPAHGRLRPPLVVHLADQRQFARCSNRAVSRER